MTTTKTPPIRLICILAICTALAACGGNKENDAVRDGPQAVHPSPSALAQGNAATSTDGAYVTGSSKNDGSQPIFP